MDSRRTAFEITFIHGGEAMPSGGGPVAFASPVPAPEELPVPNFQEASVQSYDTPEERLALISLQAFMRLKTIEVTEDSEQQTERRVWLFDNNQSVPGLSFAQMRRNVRRGATRRGGPEIYARTHSVVEEVLQEDLGAEEPLVPLLTVGNADKVGEVTANIIALWSRTCVPEAQEAFTAFIADDAEEVALDIAHDMVIEVATAVAVVAESQKFTKSDNEMLAMLIGRSGPKFALEWLAGKTVNDWCLANNLNTEEWFSVFTPTLRKHLAKHYADLPKEMERIRKNYQEIVSVKALAEKLEISSETTQHIFPSSIRATFAQKNILDPMAAAERFYGLYQTLTHDYELPHGVAVWVIKRGPNEATDLAREITEQMPERPEDVSITLWAWLVAEFPRPGDPRRHKKLQNYREFIKNRGAVTGDKAKSTPKEQPMPNYNVFPFSLE